MSDIYGLFDFVIETHPIFASIIFGDSSIIYSSEFYSVLSKVQLGIAAALCREER